VHHAVALGRSQSVCNRRTDSPNLFPRHRAADRPEVVAEVLAFEQLGDGEGDISLPAEVVDLEDARVREPGHRLGFTFEPREPVWIARHRLGQHLDRDIPVELAVPGAVDLTHAARTQGFDYFVTSETATSRKMHSLLQLVARQVSHF